MVGHIVKNRKQYTEQTKKIVKYLKVFNCIENGATLKSRRDRLIITQNVTMQLTSIQLRV